MGRETPSPHDDVACLHAISEAAAALRQAQERRDQGAMQAEQDNVHRLVQRARRRGLSWQSVGDALGLRRGNAYQKYRREIRDDSPSGPLFVTAP